MFVVTFIFHIVKSSHFPNEPHTWLYKCYTSFKDENHFLLQLMAYSPNGLNSMCVMSRVEVGLSGETERVSAPSITDLTV